MYKNPSHVSLLQVYITMNVDYEIGSILGSVNPKNEVADLNMLENYELVYDGNTRINLSENPFLFKV